MVRMARYYVRYALTESLEGAVLRDDGWIARYYVR